MLDRQVAAGEVVVPAGEYFAMGDKAPTEDLLGESADSTMRHLVDLGEHFFTRTRWERTIKLVRGFPDSELPGQPLPVNAGSPNP